MHATIATQEMNGNQIPGTDHECLPNTDLLLGLHLPLHFEINYYVIHDSYKLTIPKRVNS